MLSSEEKGEWEEKEVKKIVIITVLFRIRKLARRQHESFLGKTVKKWKKRRNLLRFVFCDDCLCRASLYFFEPHPPFLAILKQTRRKNKILKQNFIRIVNLFF